MDVAGLEKMSKQTILTICMVLGFLSFGYATGEFEVTEERLGVYRCEEHLDNPKVRRLTRCGDNASCLFTATASSRSRRATPKAKTPAPLTAVCEVP